MQNNFRECIAQPGVVFKPTISKTPSERLHFYSSTHARIGQESDKILARVWLESGKNLFSCKSLLELWVTTFLPD